MLYQAKFKCEEEKISAIFDEVEISKRFNEVLKENKEFLLNQMSSIREYLLPLLEDEELKIRILDDNVTLKFIEATKFKILCIAVNSVFDNMNFDVKQNILNLLSGNDIQYLLRESMVVTFYSLTDCLYGKELGKFLQIYYFEEENKMSNSEKFINQFMEKLSNRQLKKDTEPQSNDGVELTTEFVKQKNESYITALEMVNQVLNTDIPYNGDNINSRD